MSLLTPGRDIGMGRAARSGQRWSSLGHSVFLTALLALAGCGSTPPPEPEPLVVTPGPGFRVGGPYRINGRWYLPEFVIYYEAIGMASWYGAFHHGRPTANGETFDMYALTAAHPTLQLPSVVRVTNRANGRSLLVRVNDRGPFAEDRLIALSQAAARELGFEEQGVTEVHVQYLGLAPFDEEPIRPGEPREYAARSCELSEPDRLVC
jgi:rare lipoprotein A